MQILGQDSTIWIPNEVSVPGPGGTKVLKGAAMERHRLAVLLGILSLCIVFSACANSQAPSTSTPQLETATPAPQPDIEFQADGTASLSIPSLNGNQIAIRIINPEGNGPFPALIGVAGGDGQHLFNAGLGPDIQEMGIVAVDFAPQGRGASEGQDDHHGPIHQDDLKAVVDFVSSLSFVQQDNMGILSHSYGVVLATGALSRHPEMPVAFLLDVEGPACPGRDLVRGLENNEPWAEQAVRLFGGKDDLSPEEYAEFELHGGAISDEAYWSERDAARFAEDLPCPYLRVQFDRDHVQGTSKYHMMEIINAATEHSGQWTRCNDNPANVVYSEDELSNYHFHEYSEGVFPGSSSATEEANAVLLTYIKEMIFSKPYKEP